MAGHTAKITIESTGQLDSITLDDVAVDLLYPGNPQQTVEAIRDEINANLENKVRVAASTIVVSWFAEHVVTAT